MIGKKSPPRSALKRWRLLAVCWPLLCVAFAVVISQSDRTPDERISDVMFTLFPLVFFFIGMSTRRRLLEERGHATASTTAVVTANGMRRPTGKNKRYFPEFSFQANGTNYHVTASHGSGSHQLVEEGEQVVLCYNPENPRLFYVPALQKHDRRVSLLLCGIGIVFPLIGLFAPQIRALFPF